VLSDEPEAAGPSLDHAGPGDLVVHDEREWVFVADWERGDELGWVTIEETVTTRPGHRPFRATFDLEGYDPIEVTGVVPGDGTWVGRGRGSGRGGDRTGAVAIEGRNPKSWG